MKKFFWNLFKKIFVVMFVTITALVIGVLYYIEFQLPNIDALNTIQLQVPLQIYSKDGKLIAEYGEKRRIPVPFEKIPKPLIEAVLATEDQRYFQHPGIDIPGLLRATVKLIATGKKEQGGSTITMQVARTFYLTRHKTFGRKLREILLALKIDHRLSKEKILELYLNKIFLGSRAYGVGAAAEIYYGKSLNKLSIDQYAMLAGLPQAPTALNPITYPEAAKRRRDHVLARMYELHYIDLPTYQKALTKPLRASYHSLQTQVKAPYAAELVRQQLEQMYGDVIYTDGFNVYTTIDSNLQDIANQSVRDGLIAYDQRHGYRGPEKNLGKPSLKKMMAWKKTLSTLGTVNGLEAAVVLEINDKSVLVMRASGSFVHIPWEGLSWARPHIHRQDGDFLGRYPRDAWDILNLGDVIRISRDDKGSAPIWHLAQVPKAEAGLVAMNPQNGAIQAIVGGFDFQRSNFDRITDALRQPGSSFKPFIYSAALDKGYTLATVINDAPIVIQDPIDGSLWRPQNDTHRFYGPTRLREGLIHSRNLVSIRLLQLISPDYAVKYVTNFGFSKNQLPPTLSLALGTASVTPLDMATGYSVFANGGYKVSPFIIDKILNTQGQVTYQAKPLLPCKDCKDEPAVSLPPAKVDLTAHPQDKPEEKYAPRIISSQNAFLITSALHDVIEKGTAIQAKSLNRSDLSGKTGTTNNQVDAWFVGYNSDLVALSWVGYDQPRSLHEYGAQAALPLWIQFMQQALKGKPEHTLIQPPKIVSIRIDPLTGARAPGDDSGMFEFFMEPYLPGDEPEEYQSMEQTAGTQQGAPPENPNYPDEDNSSSNNQMMPNGGIY